MDKVLISCPPMIKQKEHLIERCKQLGIEPYWAQIIQQFSEKELIEKISNFDGWIIGDDPCTRSVIAKGKSGKLRALVKWGIGVDNIDFAACTEFKMPISNTPNMFGDEVADLAIAYLINLERKIIDVHNGVLVGQWLKPTGSSVKGKIAGIVGLGDIGKAIAQRLNVMGINAIGYDPYLKDKNVEKFIKVNTWPEEVEKLDYLFLACSLTEETRHLINSSTISKFKPMIKIINVSRGPLINEKDLIQAIDNNLVGGAALDVFEEEPLSKKSPLLNYKNLIFGAHNASNTFEAVMRTSYLALEKMADFLKSQP